MFLMLCLLAFLWGDPEHLSLPPPTAFYKACTSSWVVGVCLRGTLDRLNFQKPFKTKTPSYIIAHDLSDDQ